MSYDSLPDTLAHIRRVNELLTYCANALLIRGGIHDKSKLDPFEKEGFDKYTPLLAGSTYGSLEYKENLEKLKVYLEHHYKRNSHHPEHYPNGVNGFDLFDLVEMAMDWCAAVERHDNGNIFTSLEINTKRFGLSKQVAEILYNTFYRLSEIGVVESKPLPFNYQKLGFVSVDESNVERLINNLLDPARHKDPLYPLMLKVAYQEGVESLLSEIQEIKNLKKKYEQTNC